MKHLPWHQSSGAVTFLFIFLLGEGDNYQQGLTGSRYPTRPELFFKYPTRPDPKIENDWVPGN